MQLPANLQRFPHPTLIVTGDHITMRFFLVGGDMLEELDSLAEPRERRSDDEGSFSGSDGVRTGDPSADVDDTPREKKLMKRTADNIQKLVREHEVSSVHLLMPADLDHHLASELQPDVTQRLGKVLHVNVMKEEPLQMIERLFA
jgi:hypothetical protein